MAGFTLLLCLTATLSIRAAQSAVRALAALRKFPIRVHPCLSVANRLSAQRSRTRYTVDRFSMEQFHHTVSILQTDEGFSVWVPRLPGCASQGQTEAEALDNIRDAISGYPASVDELSARAEQRKVVLQR